MADRVDYRLLSPDDAPLLLEAAEGLFDNPVDPAQAAAFLADPNHLILCAVDGKAIVGFASGTVILHPDKPPSLFVNEVGVRDEWLRQGIGRSLCEGLMAAGRARGCGGAWLGTEPDNDPALGLYRKLGGREVPFVGFDWNWAGDA